MTLDTLQGTDYIELEVTEGLEDLVLQELKKLSVPTSRTEQKKGAVRFHYKGSIQPLTALNSVIAAYVVLSFDIPRPKALLGHQHLSRLLTTIENILDTDPHQKFNTFALSVAGKDSSVMRRIAEEISRATNLPEDDRGDLFLRIRKRANWEVLIRLTPRPLATRDWRVCNMRGALHGPVAYGMSVLAQAQQDQTFLNICCGTGSILIEHLRHNAAHLTIGVEIDSQVLECARENVLAANLQNPPQFIQADATNIPLPDHSVDVICGDLPFGQHIGTHDDNKILYPRIFQEAHRLLTAKGRLLLLSHEVKLIESVLHNQRNLWALQQEIMISLRGLHPRIYVLEKR